MDRNIVAIIVQESSKLVSEMLRTRAPKRPPSLETPHYEVLYESPPEEEKATSIEAGCVPCAIGHLGTCSGLLAESLRFGRKDGIDSGEVIDRANLCLDELNAMERVDLRPELIAGLPEWEKKLANQALDESRAVRHGLEGLSTVEDLEKVAARIQTARQEIGRNWFKEKLTKMPKEEKSELVEKTIEKLEGEE